MDTANLNTISMCTGIGGLELGVRQVLSTRTVCYVEREAFAIAVLAHQMRKGALDVAPVWTDLTTFDGKPWRGKVDLITAGFPCQPHSAAGKRKGTQDERWIWEYIVDIIRDVGPRLVFLENVPGLRHTGFERVLGSLADVGFDVEWLCVRASDVGAPHKRERLFILAYTTGERLPWPDKVGSAHTDIGGTSVAYTDGVDTTRVSCCCRPAGRFDSALLSVRPSGVQATVWPVGPGEAQHSWEPPRSQPPMGGGSDGAAVRVDRLRAIGNAVVPAQAAFALRVLLARITEETTPCKNVDEC